jgi:hypothetical protein
MYHPRSRTRSREDSVKRRQLEARRVPPLRFESDGGLHTYRLHRPTTGRDVLSPLPPEPRIADAQSAWARAAQTAQPVRAPEPRARPVVSPVMPLAQTLPLGGAIPPPERTARPTPAPAPVLEEAAAAPAEPENASPAPAPAAGDSTDRIARPSWSPVGLRPTVANQRVGWGWWIALAGAAAFFVGTAALWIF